MMDMKKGIDNRARVARGVESVQRGVLYSGLDAEWSDMEWYAGARRMRRRSRILLSVIVCVAVFGLSTAFMPEKDYYYMIGDGANSPQAVCANLREVFYER